jgi:hypothetical protein
MAAGPLLKIPEHVVFRSFPAETVVLNLETGQYHGLNPTAGKMLDALAESGRIDVAAETIAEAYTAPLAQVRTDLERLVAEMLERGLLISSEAAPEQ